MKPQTTQEERQDFRPHIERTEVLGLLEPHIRDFLRRLLADADALAAVTAERDEAIAERNEAIKGWRKANLDECVAVGKVQAEMMQLRARLALAEKVVEAAERLKCYACGRWMEMKMRHRFPVVCPVCDPLANALDDYDKAAPPGQKEK
jgi:hypothetical protein